MTKNEQWRPIPGFDGHEISDSGRVRRLEIVAAGDDGTVALRGPGGRSYRSVRKLLAEVWRDALPEALRRGDAPQAATPPVKSRPFRISDLPHLRSPK